MSYSKYAKSVTTLLAESFDHTAPLSKALKALTLYRYQQGFPVEECVQDVASELGLSC